MIKDHTTETVEAALNEKALADEFIQEPAIGKVYNPNGYTYKELVNSPYIPMLYIQERVFRQIKYITEKLGDCEYAILLVIKNVDPDRMHYAVVDFYMPKQKAWSVGVSIDVPDSTEFVKELKKIPFFSKDTNSFVAHLHSHNSMGAEWSGIDVNQQSSVTDLGFQGTFRFYVVVNTKDDINSRLCMYSPVATEFSRIPVIPYIPAENDEEPVYTEYTLSDTEKAELDTLIETQIDFHPTAADMASISEGLAKPMARLTTASKGFTKPVNTFAGYHYTPYEFGYRGSYNQYYDKRMYSTGYNNYYGGYSKKNDGYDWKQFKAAPIVTDAYKNVDATYKHDEEVTIPETEPLTNTKEKLISIDNSYVDVHTRKEEKQYYSNALADYFVEFVEEEIAVPTRYKTKRAVKGADLYWKSIVDKRIQEVKDSDIDSVVNPGRSEDDYDEESLIEEIDIKLSELNVTLDDLTLEVGSIESGAIASEAIERTVFIAKIVDIWDKCLDSSDVSLVKEAIAFYLYYKDNFKKAIEFIDASVRIYETLIDTYTVED